MAHGYGLYFAESMITADENYRKRMTEFSFETVVKYGEKEITNEREIYLLEDMIDKGGKKKTHKCTNRCRRQLQR